MAVGLDGTKGGRFNGQIRQIMEAERAPIKNIETRKMREETKLKLFQEFKNKFSGFEKNLSEFTDFKKFRELKTDLGDGSNIVRVTVDKDKAQPGSYTLQVDQLATRSSILSNGFENPDAKILGVGYINAETSKGDPVEVFVDEENSSLRGIAALINGQRDLPIQASVIRDSTDGEKPWKLLVSAKQDGVTDNVQFPELYFMDGEEEFFIDHTNDAQNALISIDGFEIEAPSNDISEFIQGVNLHLHQARPDQPFTLRIAEDTQKISGKVKGLVDQVNGILDFINKQNQVDQSSDTRTTFTGDSSLSSIEFRLRNLMHEGFPIRDDKQSDGYRLLFLSDLGITFTKTGSLEFKEEKFNKLLETDYRGIEEGITGENGFAAQIREVVGGYTRGGNGLLAVREKGLRDGIRRLDDQISQKEKRLEDKQQRLIQQFAKLEASLASMQEQQNYLRSALPSGGGGDLMSQLMGG
ncbi:flagellar filament capping protein FliD [bacterium]|nr:flagellar filament capping protein FliD [bacterium]